MKWSLFFLLALCPLAASSLSDSILSETSHELQLPGGPLAYKATVGSLPVRDEKGESLGDLFYIAYRAEGSSAEKRPLTFAFNGGPGSSSVWLHLGAFGPKRVPNIEEGQPISPPYRWIDNLDTILDATDLVFIDPIGTGLSRVTDEEKEKLAYTTWGDVASIGDFISDYITFEGRWLSPKYLAGESYGSHRAAGLADYLQAEHGIYLNGLILISSAIDYQTFCFDRDNPLPYTLFLPSFAATAWYHGCLPSDKTLADVLDEARAFALETYAPALWKNGRIPAHLYAQIAFWTGLPLSVIERQNGLIDDEAYFTELLADEKKLLGRFDGRATGDWLYPYRCYYDPSATQLWGLYSAAIHDYLSQELECPLDWPRYLIGSAKVHQSWRFQSFGYPNMMDSLRSALLQNPEMRIFNACGYFDLATPFAATEYCFKRLQLPCQVSFGYYEGGHMFYTNPAALKQFKSDLLHFYTEKSPNAR